MLDFFIDWLSVQQFYPEGGLPLVGKSVMEEIDSETGERLSSFLKTKGLEGSFSTTLKVRCDGFTVRVEGNPSRWQRMDNLFGLRSLNECIDIYNHILKQFNLPPFTVNTKVYFGQAPEDKTPRLIGDGAEITRIDWTRNHKVGKGREVTFIRAMSSTTLGRSRTPAPYPDFTSCYWGKRSWKLSKIYSKAHELKNHLRKDKRKKDGVSQEQLNYIEKLISYCEQHGVVREEHQLSQKYLKRYNLQFYGKTTLEDFIEHIKDLENIMKKLTANHDTHKSISDQLLEQGIVKSRQAANATQSVALMWQLGQKIEKNSQYYVHRPRLKSIGIDIALPFDVTRICPTLKRSEVIEVQSLSIPEWYQLPVVEKSNIMPFRAIA